MGNRKKAITLDQLVYTKKKSSEDVKPSAHIVHQVEIKARKNHHIENKSPNSKPVIAFYKKCSEKFFYPTELAEMEAALSGLYRLLMNDQAADIRPVIDENKEVIGVASLALPGWKDMSKQPLNKAELLNGNIAKALVSSYLIEEDDLHSGNIGIDESGQICRLDDDMSCYPLSSKIKKMRFICGIFIDLPDAAYEITESDIKNFPKLRDAQPTYWVIPTFRLQKLLAKFPSQLSLSKVYKNEQEFRNLITDSMFIKQKYMYFLKAILIDDDMLEQAFRLQSGNKKIRNDLLGHFSNRFKILRKVLIGMKEFRKYFLQNPGYLDMIIKEFHAYNELEKEYLDSPVDENKIKIHYKQIYKECFVEEIIGSIDNIQKILQDSVEEFEFEEDQSKRLIVQSALQQIKQFHSHILNLLTTHTDFNQIFAKEYQNKLYELEKCFEKLTFSPARKSEINIAMKRLHGKFEKWSKDFIHEKTQDPAKGFAAPDKSKVALHWQGALQDGLSYWFFNQASNESIITALEDAYKDYKPSGYSMRALTSTRDLDFKQLREKFCSSGFNQNNRFLLFKELMNILDKGNWKLTYRYVGMLMPPSLNVLIIRYLCLQSFNYFKTQTKAQSSKHEEKRLMYKFIKKFNKGKITVSMIDEISKSIYEDNLKQSFQRCQKNKQNTHSDLKVH